MSKKILSVGLIAVFVILAGFSINKAFASSGNNNGYGMMRNWENGNNANFQNMMGSSNGNSGYNENYGSMMGGNGGGMMGNF